MLVPGIFAGSSISPLVRKKKGYSSRHSGVYVANTIKKSMKSKKSKPAGELSSPWSDVCAANIIRNSMKSRKSKPVGELIDNWNHVRLAALDLAYSR
jgi:hypothetical protein